MSPQERSLVYQLVMTFFQRDDCDCDLRLVCGIATTVHIHATGSGSDEAQVILPPRAS